MRKIRLLRRATLLAALIIFGARASNAQSKRYSAPQDFQGIVKIVIPFPADYPPINSGMPYDVMLGYIYYDSLVRYFNEHNTLRSDSIGLTFGADTIRKALKYAYEMTDYDPTAWFQYQQDGFRSLLYRHQYDNTPPFGAF